MLPLPPITQALILTNIIVYCLGVLFPSPIFIRLFALWPLDNGFLPWQIISYAFLHGGFGHLIFNMLGLWMFGPDLERVWGGKRYLQYYTVCIITAALAQLIVNEILGSSFPTVGASGGVYGLLLAFGLLFPNQIIMLLIPPIPIKARTLVWLFGGIELIQGILFHGSGVAHLAHLGGMLGGWLLLRYWRGQPPFNKKKRY